MRTFICSVCGFKYEEAIGIPQAGIAAGTKWEDLPENWVCPLCGAAKSEFKEVGGAPAAVVQPIPMAEESAADLHELSALELSALCSNLARGCEKQYKGEEAALFTELSKHFKSISAPAKNAETGKLLSLIQSDLETAFPAANHAAKGDGDRGAQRALVWSEKVTRILNSLLARYEKEGESMLANTNVYVCTICGFVYIGDQPPELCPVCKVPAWKFEKVEGR
ncbi:MAG: rubredoxin [Clostridia bacterium]